jgi:glucose/arabinose dehydrogenase
MAFAPDGRLFVAEKGGALVVVDHGKLVPTPFLTVPVNTRSERGLDGVVLDPHFAQNGYVYVYYTRQQGRQVFNRLSRFTADPANPDAALPGSETVILDGIPSPTGSHNGGSMHFGADGMLYLGVGDGHMGNAVAQQGNSPLGKVLRLNTQAPPVRFRPSLIFARGFRNPFTSGFDPVTGLFYVNDVGEDTWEEVNRLRRGANYGWPTCEGACGVPGTVNPVYQYRHFRVNGNPSSAITGGVFYRGPQLPGLQGAYFFGDFAKGYIWVMPQGNPRRALTVTTTATGVDDLDLAPDGSLAYLSFQTGSVFALNFNVRAA